jgi:hypothetical protein
VSAGEGTFVSFAARPMRLKHGGFVGGASQFLVMAGFVLVGPPLAACLLRRSTRHVASDGPTSNKSWDAPVSWRAETERGPMWRAFP